MKKLRVDPMSVLAFLGAGALLYGVWQVHRPSAWILGGVIAITFAVLTTAARKRETQ